MGENFIGSQQWQEQQAQLSRITGAVAGALATGKAEGVYSGADAAEVVERFNRQLHLAEIKAINELAQGDRVKQERFLAASCRQVNCTAQASLNSAERMQAETLMARYPNTPEEEGILTHYWIQKEKKRFGNYPALTGFEQIQLFTYTDADKLSDSQTFAKNQWIESASKATGWSKETIEALGLSMSLVGLVRGQKRGGTKVAPNTFGITQSRINLMKGDKRAGWEHVVERHFSGKTNASQFSISQQELRAILQDKSSVQTPISRTIPSNESPRDERVIDVGKPIGFDKFSGGASTSIMTVLTDKHGNLITATPGRIQ
ncbi:hypothetical protein [Yersinia aleksiciae]|uniref:hypothetical protein n=1 Tax=Yersinia aleksiciae TaxID=263819 RepID=UPI0028F406E2|nr:hypothetical protein [Yersinia aleksiciae]